MNDFMKVDAPFKEFSAFSLISKTPVKESNNMNYQNNKTRATLYLHLIVILVGACSISPNISAPIAPTEEDHGLPARTLALAYSGDMAIDCGSDKVDSLELYLLNKCIADAIEEGQPFRKFVSNFAGSTDWYYWIVGGENEKIYVIDYIYQQHSGWSQPKVSLCEPFEIEVRKEGVFLRCIDSP